MLFKKKKPETAPENTQPAEQDGEVKIKKDIKLLWIYTGLFCLFALTLIFISSFVQGKMHSDYWQDQYEGEKTNSQSIIKNIQTENTALKNENAALKKENAEITSWYKASEETINNSAALVENYEYLILAQYEARSGSKSKAREYLKKIDAEMLSDDMSVVYDKLCKNLGV